MKGETLKMYRVMGIFHKANVIQLIRWSFNRPGFRLNPNDLLAPLTVNPQDVLEQITRPECTLDELIDILPIGLPVTADSVTHRSDQIPGPSVFAVILQAYIKTVGSECFLCGHIEEENTSEGQETTRKRTADTSLRSLVCDNCVERH
jgi:hypothetical protein